MDYTSAIKGLLSEVKAAIQFRRMNTLCKVLCIIAVLPLIIAAFSAVCGYYVVLFFYRGLCSPLEYIHNVVKKEGQEVHPGAQLVIYLICFPTIFFLHLLISFASLMFYFLWFAVMFFTYLATLGGVRWQPFLFDAKYGEVKAYEVKPCINAATIFGGITIFFYLLFVLALILEVETLPAISAIGFSLCLFIVNPIMFRKLEVVFVEEEVPAE